ncbi:ATP-binding protein [Nonomuraea gerenzanensis]|uniref:Putative sensor-like histidine kinase n=1 Tax=Nonomuraea gerenzanensis TaxID=93944 RepID=A0A1M4E9U8_9ACTN|nr:ATP-binding protein [Nonomuraea gerenzanensis]UBU17838.1 ATP-binding protein [Nonomuraea gerenzanensis]SBO95626.1 Putative sensor-like histidine kinase [Nonomuraea gerenzanensis]
MAGVVALALAGVLIYRHRVLRELTQTRAQLTETRHAHERLSREGAQREQRLRQAEHQAREAEHQAREAERQAREAAEEARELRAQQDLARGEAEHLLSTRIPALVRHLRAPHVTVPGLRDPALAGTEVDRQHLAVLDAVSGAVREETVRIDEAAQAIVRGAMARVQTQALRAQDLLAAVQQRYSGDEHTELLREVLGLDMFNELIVRRAQATGIACGATAGLSRDDTYLVDLVVGAIARVENFDQRIEGPANHLRRRVGVAARAAEPILFVTSELLANAVHHSHGTLKVTIAVHETNTGAAIVIDDAGVGLNEEQYARASRLLSGRHAVRLVDLGNPPHTGWAAIGRQVAQYGMQVTVKKSAYGGVQAVVSVPAGLLVEMPENTRPSVLAPEPVRPVVAAAPFQRRMPEREAVPQPVPASASASASAAAASPSASASAAAPRPVRGAADAVPARATALTDAPTDPGTTPAGAGSLPGLPQRRRQSPRRAPSSAAAAPLTTPEEAQKRWGDFQTGAEAGRREAMPSQQDDATEGN